MGRRERLEAKLEKRLDWADGREKKSSRHFKAADTIASGIPMGQPILVGHHSEKHHRRDVARIDSNMRNACESADMAQHHRGKAAGIEHQLDSSIFSDDHDAIEALEARIAELEAKRSGLQALRKKNGKTACPIRNYREPAGFTIPNEYHAGETFHAPQVEMTKAEFKEATRYGEGGTRVPLNARHRVRTVWKVRDTDSKDHGKPDESGPVEPAGPVPEAWEISNLGGNIGRLKKRLETVAAQQDRAAAAEEAGGVSIEIFGESAQVTFAEKPERSVLVELKAAGFYWSGGSWHGSHKDLPESAREV
jgi:hypothetical protein